MIVILAVTTDTRAAGSLAAIAIGGTIGLEALVLGPITGASMNPARSLAPALVTGTGRTSGSTWWARWSVRWSALVIYEALRGPQGHVVGPADAQLPVVVEEIPDRQ